MVQNREIKINIIPITFQQFKIRKPIYILFAIFLICHGIEFRIALEQDQGKINYLKQELLENSDPHHSEIWNVLDLGTN